MNSTLIGGIGAVAPRTATESGPRIAQVEGAIQRLEQVATFLEKHTEQLIQRLIPIIAPVPAVERDNEKNACGGSPFCPVASLIQQQVERIDRIANGLGKLTEIVEV